MCILVGGAYACVECVYMRVYRSAGVCILVEGVQVCAFL